MNDKETTVSDLRKLITKFRDLRGWKKFHAPRNLATSIVLESSELLELFQWDLETFSAAKIKKDEKRMEEIKKEMADIIIYSLLLADVLGIDVSRAIVNKVNHNAKKYPVRYFNKMGQDSEYYKRTKVNYRGVEK
jgi:NTP pyrophosphatase (non-canonical NTP hydrolase)